MRVRPRDHQHLPADPSAPAAAAATAVAAVRTAIRTSVGAAAAAAAALIRRGKVRVRLLQQELGVRERLGKGRVAAAAAAAQQKGIQPRAHVGGAVAPVRALQHRNAARRVIEVMVLAGDARSARLKQHGTQLWQGLRGLDL